MQLASCLQDNVFLNQFLEQPDEIEFTLSAYM